MLVVYMDVIVVGYIMHADDIGVGSGVERICAIRFLAGCRKRRILALSFPEFLLLRVALFSVSTWIILLYFVCYLR